MVYTSERECLAWVNDVAQGFSYNSETGVYTYRPQNVDATGASMEVWHFRKKVWPNIGMWERI